MAQGGELSLRVLVLAPIGRDAELLVQALTAKDHAAVAFVSIADFVQAFRDGCGAALLTEEALHLDRTQSLSAAVHEQPEWSEVPFVVLTSRGAADERVKLTLGLMQPLRNVTVLERPVRPSTIVSALEAALRDRRRQYEVREALEALRQANLELESRVQERTVDLMAKIAELEGFTYSISHDMRTPLRSIVSNARIVLEEEGDRVSAHGRDGLERLAASALKMARLIDDLLQFARIGGQVPSREECDLSELAERTAAEILQSDPHYEGTVTVTPGLVAQCDARLTGLIVHNLIENAFKYRKPGLPARIEVGKREDGVFYVRDQGIGFDMRFEHKLFALFERLHRDVEYPGTGIGLANVKRVVERHGGRTWAESKPGEGATFFFTLAPEADAPR